MDVWSSEVKQRSQLKKTLADNAGDACLVIVTRDIYYTITTHNSVWIYASEKFAENSTTPHVKC